MDVGPYLKTMQLESSEGIRVIYLDLKGRRHPNELVEVPVGTYLLRRASIRLRPGKDLETNSAEQVEINPGTTNRFVLGPPFRHDVTETRVGGTIRVTELLKGG